MKRNVRKSALAVIAIAVLLAFGLGASALMPPINVPADYDTITEALTHAVPGSTILVAATYDSEDAEESFPITVTLDNITLLGTSGATLRVPASSAGVVFKGVTGGKVEGFRITSEMDVDPELLPPDTELGDIGVVVKESSNVTVIGNTIYNLLEGIRLINASYNTIENNTLYDIGEDTDTTTAVVRNGIGIFLEVSDNNSLSGNEVYDSGMGLFLFESAYNDVVGDSYHDNTFMGVDLNDSSRNGLDGLSVKDNGTWGIYLSLSAENVVENCEVSGNKLGGIELAGSSLNTISSNYIHDNGNGDQDNFQLVLAEGGKALFTSPIFDAEQALGEIDKIRDKKHFVEWQVGLFEDWLIDVDEELIEIEQKILIARGMAQAEVQTASVVAKIQEAIDEKHCIVGFDAEDDHVFFIGALSDCSHRAGFTTLLTDPTKNFSLEGAGSYFERQFDSLYVAKTTETGDGVIAPQPAIMKGGWKLVTEDYEETKYPYTKMKILVLVAEKEGILLTLTEDDRDDIMKGRETDFPLPEEKESLTKEGILQILGVAMRYEIDEIMREVEDLQPPIAIDEYLKDEILGKLQLIKDMLISGQNKLDNIRDRFGPVTTPGVIGGGTTLDDYLDDAITEAGKTSPDWPACQGYLNDARDVIKGEGEIVEIKDSIFDEELWWINRKLWEINQELPPEVLFNGTIIGKKEKVGSDITDDEIYDDNGTPGDTTDDTGVKASLVTALNKDALAQAIRQQVEGSITFVAADIEVENFDAVCSTENVVESNVFTTQVITNGYNVAIGLECANNTIVNNLITNEDILNGRAGFYGTMDRGILMLSSHNLVAYNAIEYVDVGIVRGGSWTRKDVQQEFVFKKLAKAQVDANERPLSIIAVMEVFNTEIFVVIPDREVKWNRISLNLIEHTGYGIQIVEAESNQIDENMFIENTDGGIYFMSEVGPHIIMVHNDFVGGISVVNAGGTTRDASENYALDSPTSGPVTDPEAETPFCSDNFGTIDKFEDLEIERFFNANYPTLPPMAQSSDLRRLVVAGVTFTLPDEKPRTCADVFGGTQPTPGGECCDLTAVYNLVSPPVNPDSTDPRVVFADAAGTDGKLYLGTYDTAAGVFEWVDKPATATLGTAGALTTVDPLAGYWLAVQYDGQYCVTGTALTGDQVVDLSTWAASSNGWFMIGVPYETAWGDATGAAVKFTHGGVDKWLPDAVAAGWLYGTILNWDATALEWIRTTVEEGTTLEPCVGYWIRARVHDLTMTFTTAAWDPGNPPTFGTQSLKSEDPGNPPMPIHPTPLTFDPSKLEFGNYPNPITDVHTTTFAVKGVMAAFVDAIKVQIFDLSGQKVYEEEMSGTSIDWHTDNDYGEYLANGVYLYKMYAKVDGQWVVSEVKKLAILR